VTSQGGSVVSPDGDRRNACRTLLLLAVAAHLAGCGGGDAVREEGAGGAYASGTNTFANDEAAEEDKEAREPFDEDAARDSAEDDMAGETYDSLGRPYGCSDDCSGHEAGFRYRAENGYAGFNADSPSFNEGGQAFDEAVEERIEEMRDEYEATGEMPD
jgi:hypothetical protein